MFVRKRELDELRATVHDSRRSIRNVEADIELLLRHLGLERHVEPYKPQQVTFRKRKNGQR